MKTVSNNLLAHFQSECQTRAIIWALKLNYRRINIASAGGTSVTTVEDHGLVAGMFFAISNGGGTSEDVATGAWKFHEVASASAKGITTVDSVGSYGGGGTLHESYGFTSNVVPIKRDGMLFKADISFTPTATEVTDTLAVPTTEMEGVMLPPLSSLGISEDDIAGGRLDFAEIRTQMVNYEALADGGMWLSRGFIGKVTVKNDQYIAELRGLSQIASQQILELYSPGCRYDLGSRRCTVNTTSYMATGSIGSIVDDRIKFTGIGGSDGYYDYGKVTFTSGNNSGLAMEVKTFVGGVVELWQPMPFAFQGGDGFEIVAGCDKTLATCRDKFANLINHGGFPHLPGEDELAKVLVPRRPDVETTG